MTGLDPGAIAQNIITYFGGAPGGFLVLAAVLVAGLLSAIGWAAPHRMLHTFYFGGGAWVSAWAVRTILAWA